MSGDVTVALVSHDPLWWKGVADLPDDTLTEANIRCFLALIERGVMAAEYARRKQVLLDDLAAEIIIP